MAKIKSAHRITHSHQEGSIRKDEQTGSEHIPLFSPPDGKSTRSGLTAGREPHKLEASRFDSSDRDKDPRFYNGIQIYKYARKCSVRGENCLKTYGSDYLSNDDGICRACQRKWRGLKYKLPKEPREKRFVSEEMEV